jgi:hypothetical protein
MSWVNWKKETELDAESTIVGLVLSVGIALVALGLGLLGKWTWDEGRRARRKNRFRKGVLPPPSQKCEREGFRDQIR